MSDIYLEKFFNPKSIAVIGASRREYSVGRVVMRNLLRADFDGMIMPVNPKYNAIEGVRAYPNIASLPEVPDLAVICTPPNTVPDIVGELADYGTKAVIVITAGFGEGDSQKGEQLKLEMLKATGDSKLRIIGPNCLGVIVPGAGVNASFVHVNPHVGNIAFLSQSGALATSIVDWATSRGVGFSHVVSLGAMSDVDFGDMLSYLKDDDKTEAILLYMESIKEPEKFLRVAREVCRQKPVIVIKSGRHEAGAKAISSHTGALAGADEVYDAAFRRTGMLRVYDIDELFDATEILAKEKSPGEGRLAILTNGGGMGIVAVDSLMDLKGDLAELSEKTIQKLNKVLPPTWSHSNPVDILGDAPGERYQDALNILLKAKEVDAVLVLNCPTAISSTSETAKAVIDVAVKKTAKKPVYASWLGEGAAHSAREMFYENNIPSFDTPGQAIRAFMHTVDYAKNQKIRTRSDDVSMNHLKKNKKRVEEIFKQVKIDGRHMLSEVESKQVFAAYQIPIVETYSVKTAVEAQKVAEKIKGKKVIKVLSKDITHKTDVGGVRLGLLSSQDVFDATESMLQGLRKTFPEANIEGVSVQKMVEIPHAREVIVGLKKDPTFGHFVLFGQGGTAVEIYQDKAIDLVPVDQEMALAMMRKTKIFKQLEGYRNYPKAQYEKVADVIHALSVLACDFPQIEELDINPLWVSEEGVVALDGRIKI